MTDSRPPKQAPLEHRVSEARHPPAGGDSSSPMGARDSDQKALQRAQRIRLNRLYMAIATYGLEFVAMYLIQSYGLGRVPPWAMATFVVAAVVANTVFYVLIRTGYNLRFRDPSMTLAQMIVASLWGWLPLYFLYDGRVIVQMFYLPAFSFGMLRLDLRRYLAVVAVIMTTYIAAVWADALSGRPGFDLSLEVFQGLVFLLILFWFAVFGGFISTLRHKLRNQNKALAEAHKRIEQQARMDELTNLYNRRFIREFLDIQKVKADQGSHTFSVAIVDIDHFKRINDLYGHGVGDEVLRRFSALAKRSLRSQDFIVDADPTMARYGGEEFLVALPMTSAAQARACLDRLRLALVSETFPHLDTPVTYSAGVTQYRPEEPIDELLKRADRAMYHAKKSGRNRVYLDTEIEVQHDEPDDKIKV